jgi:hypothetical protein
MLFSNIKPENAMDAVEQIEAEISQLSRTEQLRVLEDLSHRLGIPNVRFSKLDEEALAAMAADPAIQREIALINAEFAITDADGLDQIG